jgi:hypothetical protein
MRVFSLATTTHPIQTATMAQLSSFTRHPKNRAGMNSPEYSSAECNSTAAKQQSNWERLRDYLIALNASETLPWHLSEAFALYQPKTSTSEWVDCIRDMELDARDELLKEVYEYLDNTGAPKQDNQGAVEQRTRPKES